jgi:hypothetical protein
MPKDVACDWIYCQNYTTGTKVTPIVNDDIKKRVIQCVMIFDFNEKSKDPRLKELQQENAPICQIYFNLTV